MAKSGPGIKPLNNQPSTTSGHHSQHNCNIRKQFRPESEYYGESFEVPLNINFFFLGGGTHPSLFLLKTRERAMCRRVIQNTRSARTKGAWVGLICTTAQHQVVNEECKIQLMKKKSSCFTYKVHKLGNKTLPEAQRTQKLTP